MNSTEQLFLPGTRVVVTYSVDPSVIGRIGTTLAREFRWQAQMIARNAIGDIIGTTPQLAGMLMQAVTFDDFDWMEFVHPVAWLRPLEDPDAPEAHTDTDQPTRHPEEIGACAS